MATAATMPNQDQGQEKAPDAGKSQEQGDPLNDFRQLAQDVQKLQAKYPEFTESSLVILKEVKKAMAQVAGNPQRTQEKQAPPNGG